MSLTPFYRFFGGITEFYAFVFATAAIVLAFRGELTWTFVAMMSGTQALITGLDVHNDFRQDKCGDKDNGDQHG
jgi:hypothetical protein